MNQKSVQFKSAKDRAFEAKFCEHYRAIGIPAVIAATALKAGNNANSASKKSPNQR